MVPLRTVESPISHNVGNAGFIGVGGKYLPLPGAPFGAGMFPICVLRGTSLGWIAPPDAEPALVFSLTYFASAVSMAWPCNESSGMNGLFLKALRPETMVAATISAPGK